MDPILDQLLTEWHTAKTQSDHWQSAEKIARQKLFEHAFKSPTEGTGNKLKLPHDRTLVGDYRLSYSPDAKAIAPIMEDKKSNVRPILQKVLTFRPEVRKTEFRELSPDEARAISELITIKPGLPGLEIKTTSKMRG